MGSFHQAFWHSNDSGQTRAERRGGSYYYYLPTKLKSLDIALDSDVVSDLVRAESAIRELNVAARYPHNSEGLARFLLRAESVSSSYIEGLQIGAKRLLKAELRASDSELLNPDETATDIIGNIHAMEEALKRAQSESCVTADTIINIHRTLLKDTRSSEFAGVVRTEQNWIGGNWFNPLQAEFVPPAPQYVGDLLDDLADYCNSELVSPIQQAAIAHAQFETIHPFADGNGRTGRALIHLILRKRGLAPNLIPPISLILATFSDAYIDGLTATRRSDNQGLEHILAGYNEWISFFAGTCVRACKASRQFEQATNELQAKWRSQLGALRKGSAAELLLDELIGMPIVSLQSLQKSTGRSIGALSQAVERFVDAGILKPLSNTVRKRSFEAFEVLRIFNTYERQLASPAGNTRLEKPARPVPSK